MTKRPIIKKRKKKFKWNGRIYIKSSREMGYQLDLKNNPTGFIIIIRGKNDNYKIVA